jgi:hypothetical protein
VIAAVAQLDIRGQDAFEFQLRGIEKILAAPEGVIAVEADQADGCGGAGVLCRSLGQARDAMSALHQ